MNISLGGRLSFWGMDLICTIISSFGAFHFRKTEVYKGLGPIYTKLKHNSIYALMKISNDLLMRFIYALILALCCFDDSYGQDEFVGPPEPQQRDLLSRSHELISFRLVRLADQLDSFFGETRADDEINQSSIRIIHGRTLRMEKGPLEETNIRINLRLKNLEKLLKFNMKILE